MTLTDALGMQRRCTLHGEYWGIVCPSCNSAIPQSPPVPLDPVHAYNRIAAALERIAAALEGGDAQ